MSMSASRAPESSHPMAAPKSEEVEVEDPMDKALKELDYNAEDPGSYGGVEKLFRSAKKVKVVNGITCRR